jgi:glutaredoxin
VAKKRVTLYTARDCHLCEEALDVLRKANVEAEVEFDLEVVRIDGDAALEKRYRAWLPVVEVDGKRVFTYDVDATALAELLRST